MCIGMVQQRDGYSVGAIVSDVDVVQYMVEGYSVVHAKPLPQPKGMNTRARSCLGVVSAPDYIGQVVRLTDHLSITLGWQVE